MTQGVRTICPLRGHVKTDSKARPTGDSVTVPCDDVQELRREHGLLSPLRVLVDGHQLNRLDNHVEVARVR